MNSVVKFYDVTMPTKDEMFLNSIRFQMGIISFQSYYTLTYKKSHLRRHLTKATMAPNMKIREYIFGLII